MRTGCRPARQRGMASLVVALVLMMSLTMITLSAARTQLAETHMAGNEQWHGRLRLLAESAWETATRPLVTGTPKLVWQPDTGGDSLVSRTSLASTDTGVATQVLYRRADSDSAVIALQTVVTRPGGNGPAGRISQAVRLLTVLSPLAEAAPPLVINGCLSTAAVIDVRPVNSDSNSAGDAVWRFNSGACPSPVLMDTHAGGIVDRPLDGDLWASVFSVSREDYAGLAAGELALPSAQRHYWLADAGNGGPGWPLSLGSAERPVVLVFPATAGCPRFAAGVRIFGVVFIDAACNAPLATTRLEITGSLVVNGAVDAGAAHLRLNHIQVADPAQARLALPVLRVVKIPGSWRDF